MKQQCKMIASLCLGLSLLSSQLVKANEAKIRASFNKAMPGLEIDAVTQSQVQGVYEVQMGARIAYVSADGKYLLQGHLIDLEARKDLTDVKLADIRTQTIDKLGEDKMIIFKPENTKYTVSIFTDIDCGYCRKLHGEMDSYLAEGISVQYLFYPRAGKGSESYKKAVSVWCADDQQKAMTAAKKGNTPEPKDCENPVDEHMRLGVEFEARGTPMIVTEKGNIYPGYVPADKLVKALELE